MNANYKIDITSHIKEISCGGEWQIVKKERYRTGVIGSGVMFRMRGHTPCDFYLYKEKGSKKVRITIKSAC